MIYPELKHHSVNTAASGFQTNYLAKSAQLLEGAQEIAISLANIPAVDSRRPNFNVATLKYSINYPQGQRLISAVAPLLKLAELNPALHKLGQEFIWPQPQEGEAPPHEKIFGLLFPQFEASINNCLSFLTGQAAQGLFVRSDLSYKIGNPTFLIHNQVLQFPNLFGPFRDETQYKMKNLNRNEAMAIDVSYHYDTSSLAPLINMTHEVLTRLL
jgi:hypothetical protein